MERDAAGAGEGPFIVVEGIDGSGTTTLAGGLQRHYRERRRAVHRTCEPSPGPVGALIRQVLARRLIVPSGLGPVAPGWATMALLFAADRQDHLEAEVLPLLRDGVMVISDRFDLSSLAYQAAASNDGHPADDVISWIHALNAHARRPDLTLVLDVPADVAAQRRGERGGGRDLFDELDFQARLADLYRGAESLVPGDRLVHLDATGSRDQVLLDAVRAIDALESTSSHR